MFLLQAQRGGYIRSLYPNPGLDPGWPEFVRIYEQRREYSEERRVETGGNISCGSFLDPGNYAPENNERGYPNCLLFFMF